MIVAVFDSRESWERFRDQDLKPGLQEVRRELFRRLPMKPRLRLRTFNRHKSGVIRQTHPFLGAR